jgi:UDP-N-acetylmuramoyl-tripeptide--D-alanyl-D-alanine ligase
VGEAAAAIMTGTKAVPSWPGELLLVPEPAAAVAALSDRLRAGDVVLVKASHSIGLERVALALTGEWPAPGPEPAPVPAAASRPGPAA